MSRIWVINPNTTATLTVQSLITVGLRTGKCGEYATPPVKDYVEKG